MEHKSKRTKGDPGQQNQDQNWQLNWTFFKMLKKVKEWTFQESVLAMKKLQMNVMYIYGFYINMEQSYHRC